MTPVTSPTPSAPAMPPMSRQIKTVAFAFGLSRLLIMLAWVLTTHVQVPAEGVGDASIVLNGNAVSSTVHQLMTYNDAGWYAEMVKHGYEERPFDISRQANWAFFPLHPLMWRAATYLIEDMAWSGFLMANLLFFAALLVLFRVTLLCGFDEPTAQRAVMGAAFFPVSYFFSLPLSEPLFVLITSTCFLAALEKRWWTAGLLGALASATRLSGLFVLPALFALMWQRREHTSWRPWLAMALMPLGLAAFMAYLWSITGDPLAFSDIQPTWGRHVVHPWQIPSRVWKILINVLRFPQTAAEPWSFVYLGFALGVFGLIASAWLAWRKHFALAIFLLLGLLPALSTGTYQCFPRYVMGLFPIFIVIGVMTRQRAAEVSWFAFSCGAMAVMSVLFALGIHFAAA